MKTVLPKLAAALGLSVLTLSTALADGGFLALGFGQGDIDVDDTSFLPFAPIGNADDNAAAFSIGGGYLFPSGVYVDLAFTDLDSVTLFGLADVFRLSATKLGVGYRLKTNESFSFLAKAGISFWDLDVEESFFLNPGPELGGGSDGTDLFIEVGGEFKVGERFGITLIHSRDSYDHGDASATRIGVRYYFDNNE